MVIGVSEVYIYGLDGRAQVSGPDKQVNQLQDCDRIWNPAAQAVGR